jgi:hypothetical protein
MYSIITVRYCTEHEIQLGEVNCLYRRMLHVIVFFIILYLKQFGLNGTVSEEKNTK